MFASKSFRAFTQRFPSKSAVAIVAASSSLCYVVASNEIAPETMTANCSAARKDKKVVIVGGGTAGIGVAAMLQKEGIKNVTVIEPKDVHYYQPLWTLVGGGVKSNTQSVKPMKDIVPAGTTWVQQNVKTFAPESNKVTLGDGSDMDYDYLVVAAGLTSDFTKIPGMEKGLKQEGSGVVSVYDYNYSAKVWNDFESIRDEAKNIKKVRNLIFTMPTTTLKCAGAPQKIMWLLEDKLRSAGLRDIFNVEFWVPGGGMFAVKHYGDKLEKIRQERGVGARFQHELVSIDVDNKEATFKDRKENRLVKKAYDLIHVCPNMVPPAFIKSSPLADEKGWVDVDKHTMQSKKYSNVFALGDCTNSPNSKTAAAVTSQAPVLVHNMEQHMIHDGKEGCMDGKYQGYASCPLIVAQKRVLLAEFGYGGKLMETFGWNTGKFPYFLLGTEGAFQQRVFYFLKEQLFPFVYWNMWTKGNWYGTNGPFKPDVVEK